MSEYRKVKRKLSLDKSFDSVRASAGSPPPAYDPVYEASRSHQKEVLVPSLLNGAGAVTTSVTTHVNGTSEKRRDQDLVSAAEALTQLNHTVTPPPGVPGASSVTSPISSLTIDDAEHPLVTKVNQVSRHPLVANAVKYYEESKRNYASFNYAAEIVEKAAIPVVREIEVNLNSRHARHLKENTQKRRRVAPNDESTLKTKNRLQFCLHLLKLANDHINNKVTFLQEKISEHERELVKTESEDSLEPSSQYLGETLLEERGAGHRKMLSSELPVSPASPTEIPNETAQETKTEIITTVKKIIHMISNFKPSSLSTGDDKKLEEPELELKSNIRDIILKLPAAIQQTATSNATGAQANERILVFAKESLDMIGKLTVVFNEQLEKAEQWAVGDDREEPQASR